jgi:hypothetical protein
VRCGSYKWNRRSLERIESSAGAPPLPGFRFFPALADTKHLKSGQRVEVNIAGAAKSPSEVLRIPSCALAASLDGSFVGDLAHQIKGEVADDGHILSSVTGTQA